MENERLIKTVQTAFKLSGLNINRKCCLHLARQLRNIDAAEHEHWICRIVEYVLAQDLVEPCVSVDHIKVALKECLRPSNSLQETETILNVLDGFRVPKIKYDVTNKKFVIEQSVPNLFSEPVDKSLVIKERLELLWHRTMQNELFAPVKFGEVDTVRVKLRQIEYLLSLSEAKDVYVIGMLAQLTERQYYLEDASGYVKIDLSQADYQAHLITEGCVVLVRGDYEDRVLVVKTIGFPPSETSTESRARFGTANTFGGHHPVSLKTSEKLRNFEENNPDEMIVFISELWVDDQIVLEKLKLMLEEFSNFPPVAFVICGNFLSFPPNVTSSQKLKEGFKRLADIIAGYPEIVQNSKFVLIPGPHDPGAPRIFPRAPIPGYVVEDFIKAIPKTVLATNPCRIQYCTKEIVVFREDILTKLCRNTLYLPDDADIPKDYAKSIISQSHLTPMALPTVPIYWKHDQALQLYPTPDLIVVADQFEPYNTEYNECFVVNPGVFSKNDFPFKVYIPGENKIEDSEMEKEDQS
ncbi:DNA polymerase epsilon subunit 2 [Neodiprion virginianus]|uniref:DNA polymerase epsilon subunit n=1 Tax=Neodiprion lecontei TaxID=441921 RepID=A0ABM3GLY3_NEOLC|nr:DNA polymerase epsilon subunit 2 [Neodiprion lecontei]XP_046628066.1 DNA polymerase epsilon subunit 2 [Neodiprion virginianus]